MVELEVDSLRSTNLSTQSETNQALATPFTKTYGGFLMVDQWIKSSSAFRGTLVVAVLQCCRLEFDLTMRAIPCFTRRITLL